MAAAQTPPLGPLAQVRSMGITLPVYTCGATPVPGGTCCPGLTSLDGFVASGGMALDPARHRLYAADFENNRVQVFDSQSLARVGLISALGSSGALNLPVDAALDADGNLYVADLGNEAVEKFDANLHYVASIAAGKGLSIVGVWAEGDSVYFSTLQNYVYRYTQGVSGYSASATFGEPGQLNHPNQIVKSGNWLYVTDTYNDRLVKFDVDHPGPVPTQVVGCLLIPTGLRPDATGKWLLEESDNGGYPAYVDTFSHDFSLLKSRCVFPDTWSAVQDPATGRTFVSGMNSLSVTVLQGCGPATPVPPTATPTLTPIPPPSPTATPVPGGARASTAARPNLSRNGQP
ncbi:MAG TPA: hypothetical protein VFR02_02345, partial [bacterium]|nr:hypothetical protein [bacterium]